MQGGDNNKRNECHAMQEIFQFCEALVDASEFGVVQKMTKVIKMLGHVRFVKRGQCGKALWAGACPLCDVQSPPGSGRVSD